MFNNIFENKILNNNSPVLVMGLNDKVQASYVWNLFGASKKNILVVTNTLYEANMLYKSLNQYDKDNILLFPMDDFLVSEAVATSPDLMSKRIETLNELAKNNIGKIVITNFMGYLRFLPSRKLWSSLNIKIKETDEINRDLLIQKLNKQYQYQYHNVLEFMDIENMQIEDISWMFFLMDMKILLE